MIRGGDATVVVAGGQESMTRAPHILPGSRQGWTYGAVQALDVAAHDGLTDAFDGQSMGLSTESKNLTLGIDRTSQDNVAAAVAPARGAWRRRTASSTTRSHRSASSSARAIPSLSPPMKASAPTPPSSPWPACGPPSSPTAPSRPATPLPCPTAPPPWCLTPGSSRRTTAWSTSLWSASPGRWPGPDNSLHSQPSNAIKNALDRAGWTTADLDFIEINEAFGSVAVQSLKDLDYPLEQCNIHGGAIALGHPIGASGARLALHAAHELKRRGTGKAAVSLCGGGGQGEALLLYRD